MMSCADDDVANSFRWYPALWSHDTTTRGGLLIATLRRISPYLSNIVQLDGSKLDPWDSNRGK